MRVAITTDGRNISKDLTRTKEIEVFDIQNSRSQGRLRIDVTAGGGYEGLLYILQNEGIEVVLCGEINNEEKKDLEDYGIQVFSGARGSTNKTLSMYLRSLRKRNAQAHK